MKDGQIGYKVLPSRVVQWNGVSVGNHFSVLANRMSGKSVPKRPILCWLGR